MKELKCCIKKDLIEYIRGKRQIYFILCLILTAVMVLASTLCFPLIIGYLSREIPEIVTDVEALIDFVSNLFPQNTLDNLAVLAGDIGVFYSIVVVFVVYNIIPSEEREGKWIVPLCNGYKRYQLVLSKCIVYGLGAGLPAFLLYVCYYVVMTLILENNYPVQVALGNGVILGLCMTLIVITTMLGSACAKHGISSAITVVTCVIIGPEISTRFDFGRFLPSYILSHLFASLSNFKALLIPFAEVIVICVVLFFWKKSKKEDIL